MSAAAPSAKTFSSGEQPVPLVELFTSEGCSSCPPAEHWLGELREEEGLWRDFVPVAWHVNYWDRLGWPDKFDEEIRPISFKQRRPDHIWYRTYVTKILHDPAAIGVRDFYEIERDEEGSKKRVLVEEVRQKKVFPPIVEEEISKRAQQKKETNFAPGREGFVSFFETGRVRCGRCGEKMLIKFKGNNVRRYQCKGATERSTNCTCTSTYPV